MSELRGQRVHGWWTCKRTGRNASESRAGLERAVVDADSARTGGRLPCRGEEPTSAPMAVHRGSGSSTYARSSDATWETRLCAGLRPQCHLWWQHGRESERRVVPVKPGNSGGGKEPHFRALLKELTASDWRKPSNVRNVERLSRKLDATVKAMSARTRNPHRALPPWAARETCRRAGCGKSARPVR